MRRFILIGAVFALACGPAARKSDDLSGTWRLDYERSKLEGAAPSAPMKVSATYRVDRDGSVTTRIFGFGNAQLLHASTIRHFDNCSGRQESLEFDAGRMGLWPYPVRPGKEITAKAACWELADGTRVLHLLVKRGNQVVVESHRSVARQTGVMTEDILGLNENAERYRMTLVWDRR